MNKNKVFKCEQCGKCCDFPVINSSRWIYERKGKLCFSSHWETSEDVKFIRKHWKFVKRTEDNTLMFECLSFDKSTRRCLVYDSRTCLCKEYPYGDKCLNVEE